MKSAAMTPLLAASTPDEQLVLVTGVSILATALLGLLAWLNGHRATVIAEDAIRRDQTHRDAELALRSQAERDSVALAVLEAFASIEAVRTGTPPTYVDAQSALERERSNLVSRANAKISLYTANTDEALLLDWFEVTISRIDSNDRFDDDSIPMRRNAFMSQMLASKEGISSWARREISAKALCGIKS
ncbi:hypothetical protein [Leucobacter luti]|uniref:hypothetical protein n=1 Tax=Leucobacter luti TaxID=340320 RepID=UPI00102BB051|nr:hypothetical protein [Leucobacter luti]